MWKSFAHCNTLYKWTNDTIIKYYLIKFRNSSLKISWPSLCAPTCHFQMKGKGTWAHEAGCLSVPAGRPIIWLWDHHYLHKKKVWRLKWSQPPWLPTDKKHKGKTLLMPTSPHMPFIVYQNSGHRHFDRGAMSQESSRKCAALRQGTGAWAEWREGKNMCDVSGKLKMNESFWETNREGMSCGPLITQVYVWESQQHWR